MFTVHRPLFDSLKVSRPRLVGPQRQRSTSFPDALRCRSTCTRRVGLDARAQILELRSQNSVLSIQYSALSFRSRLYGTVSRGEPDGSDAVAAAHTATESNLNPESEYEPMDGRRTL